MKTFKIRVHLHDWLAWGALATIVLLFYGSRWFFGRLMVPNDFYIHYTWATFFTNRLTAGCVIPTWLPEVFHGLGAAIFLYYPPLYFYGVGILNLMLDNTWLSMRIVECMAAVGIAWIAVKHVREYLDASWMDCILAACAIACSPVFLARLYMLGGMPTFASCCFMTGAAVRTAEIIHRKKVGWDWLLTFWIGLLAWTHNLVVLMTLAAIFGGVLCLAVFRRRAPYWSIVGACTLGFLLGVPRYLAAYLEMPSINHQNIVQLEELLWQNNFVLPVGLKTTWAFFQWGIGGLLAFGVCLWGIILLVNRKTPSDSHAFWLGGALTCLFFALPLSWLLWAHLPPLQYFQTPTRFLEPLGLFVVFGLFCAIRELGTSRMTKCLQVPLWLLIALSVALVGRVWQRGVPVAPQLSSWIHKTSNQWEYLPAGQPLEWRTLSEVIPESVAHLPDGDVEVMAPGKDGGLVAELYQDEVSLRLLPVFHHFRWKVFLDGKEIPFQKHGETGLIQILVPEGHHRIETKWERGVCTRLSYGALLFLLLGIPIAGLWHDKRKCRRNGIG